MSLPLSDDNLCFLPASQQALLIRQGQLRSRDLLEAFYARSQDTRASLNAVICDDIGEARKRADQLDRLAAEQRFVGPLHGLPVSIKDTLSVVGMPTTAGNQAFADYRPTKNASAVQQLVDDGVVIYGKTNVPDMAADWQSHNALYGTSNNPWDSSRTPGGSSGGAAAAVSAGLTAFELGSDLGGSVRVPAHFCGVYGHKPTHGIISLHGHIPGEPGQLALTDIAALGPLARSAEDLALVLHSTVDRQPGARGEPPYTLRPATRQRVQDYKVAAWLDDAYSPVSHGISRVLQHCVTSLQGAGVPVNTRARPGFSLEEAGDVYMRLLMGIHSGGVDEAGFEAHHVAEGERAANIGEGFSRYLGLSHRNWLQANESREQMRQGWRQLFSDYDVLLAPVSITTAFPHDHSQPQYRRSLLIDGQPRDYMSQILWCGALAGAGLLPATVAPVGFTDEGLPVGIQIIGAPGTDLSTIQFAGFLGELLGGYRQPR